MLNVVDGLPRNSAYVDAVSQDEQVAEAVAARPRPEPAGPTVAEYTPTVERLDIVIDRLADLANAIIASRGGKPVKVDRMPRPRTALDRAKRHRRAEKHRRLVARVLPRKSDA